MPLPLGECLSPWGEARRPTAPAPQGQWLRPPNPHPPTGGQRVRPPNPHPTPPRPRRGNLDAPAGFCSRGHGGEEEGRYPPLRGQEACSATRPRLTGPCSDFRLSTCGFFDSLTIMDIHFYEVTNGPNWGKLAVGTFERHEWEYVSHVAAEPLLARLGHGPSTRLFLDLATGEGALFDCSQGLLPQLARHKIWVCPMFEPGLTEFAKHDIHWDPDEWRPHVDVQTLFQFEGFRRSALIRQLVDQAREDAKLSPSYNDKLWNAIVWAIGDEQPIYRRYGETPEEAAARVLGEREATFRRLFWSDLHPR